MVANFQDVFHDIAEGEDYLQQDEEPEAQKMKLQNEMARETLAKPEVIRDIIREIQNWQSKQEGGAKANYKRRTQGTVFRSNIHEFLSWVTTSATFDGLIIFTIFLNALAVAVESSYPPGALGDVMVVLDMIFFTIYNIEFILKVYCQPKNYWLDNYNLFDFLILFLSYFSFVELLFQITIFGDLTFVRVLRAMRALRALRSIAFIHALRVLVAALGKTVYDIVNFLAVLFLVMYIFAISGYYFFGPTTDERAAGLGKDWKNLGASLYTLWTFVTADGWVDFQRDLDDRGYEIARLFTVLFLFVGNMIFTNLFIGVIINNLDEAQNDDYIYQTVKRLKVIQIKKEILHAKQDKERVAAEKNRFDTQNTTVDQILTQLGDKLRHDDFVPMTHLTCNLTWIHTYLNTLTFQENVKFQNQQIHFELAHKLAELVELRHNGA